MLTGKRIAFVGAGNMAEALIKGLVASGKVRPDDIAASDRRLDHLGVIAQKYGIIAAPDNRTGVENAAIVVLAVKPQGIATVLDGIAAHVPEGALVVSIAAGITTGLIEAHLR